MSDKKDLGSKLTLNDKGRLSLKKRSVGEQTRQSFSHGRSKLVTVEVKKRRSRASSLTALSRGKKGLSEEEKAARLLALGSLESVQQEFQKDVQESEEKGRQRAALQQKKEDETEAQKESDKEPSTAPEEKEETPPTQEASPQGVVPSQDVAPSEVVASRKKKPRDGEDVRYEKRKTPSPKQRSGRRQKGKINVSTLLSGDGESDEGLREKRARSLAALRRAREKEQQQGREQLKRHEKVIKTVRITETITVDSLANRMAERVGDVIKALMKLGIMATRNQSIDSDTAQLVAEGFGHTVVRLSESDAENALLENARSEEGELLPRSPVVTVMGHVDHGKTSLLDALRQTSVAQKESGGITQHIGAYQVAFSSGRSITVLDTPGHGAFSHMRMRGAAVTDIVVLVVAADDGVRPQTEEAINHAKAANVPIVVALNKCDKPGAQPDRVRTQLLERGLVMEALGGDVLSVEISALQRQNLDKLEEAILLQAELLELKARREGNARGVILEARLEHGTGLVATVLVQDGLLCVGDTFVTGSEWGRVRSLTDDSGRALKQAPPSVPVKVSGLQGMPQVGDDLIVVREESKARELAGYRARKLKEKKYVLSNRGTVEQMFDRMKEEGQQSLACVVKADAQGSLGALTHLLSSIGTDSLKVQILHGAVGGITETDVTLAAANKGVIFGFNVRANPQARALAVRHQIDIRYYSVIYRLEEDVKALLSGMLSPEIKETFQGSASVREVFSITKVGKVAGCYVTEGKCHRKDRVRVLRDSTVVRETSVKTLRRFKENVEEVGQGFECGVFLERFDDIKVGDVIEFFSVEEIQRTL